MKVPGRSVSGSSNDLTYAYFVPAIPKSSPVLLLQNCDKVNRLFILVAVSNVDLKIINERWKPAR